MIGNIVNLFSKAMSTNGVNKTTALKTTSSSSNPFGNPFVSTMQSGSSSSYAKNNPVRGGYFAGYYNGRANIVGQRLFVEA